MHNYNYNYQSPPQKKPHSYNKQQSLFTNPYQFDQQNLTQTQYSENNNAIVINLQTKSNKKLQLNLSVQNYKNEFKQFIKRNQIEKKQASQIKKQIVTKLKVLASKNQQNNNNKSNNLMNNKYRQDYQQKQQQTSPTFSPIHQNTDEQSIISTIQHSNYNPQNHKNNKLSYQNGDQLHLDNYEQVESAYFVNSTNKYQQNHSYKNKQSPKIDKQIQTIQKGIRQVKYLQKYENEIHQINQLSFQNEADSFNNKKYIKAQAQTIKIYENKSKYQNKQKNKQIVNKQLFNTPSPKKCILLENYKSKTNISKNSNKQKNYNKSKKINQKVKYNKQQKSKSNQKQQLSKPRNHSNNYLNERQLNHNVFFKLHNKLTASFLQKSKQDINRKQQQDYKQIIEYQEYKQKSKSKSPSSSKQIFNRLYLTSTQSSFYRNKKQSSQFQCQQLKNNQSQFQIQKIIKLNQFNQIKKKTNLNSRVYESNRIKNCNQHCELYSYQKKIKKQKEISKLKQNNLKKQIKQRSMQKSIDDIYKSAKKRSGQCPCCHKDKIQQKIKQKQQKSPKRWQKWKKYSSKSPNVKVNFISDVLEQSYIQLFPSSSKAT